MEVVPAILILHKKMHLNMIGNNFHSFFRMR